MYESLILLTLLILILCVLATGGWLLLSLIGLVRTRVPYVPVPTAISDAVAEIVNNTSVNPTVFYDIGSGDGRVVFSVAEKVPTAQITGIEISPAPFLLSLFMRAHKKLPRAKLKCVDAEKVNYADATHIFLYLFPHVVKKLYPKLKQELKEGSIIVSCDFPIIGVTPHETKEIMAQYKKYTLYIYRV